MKHDQSLKLGYINIKLDNMHRYFELLEFHRFHYKNMIPDNPYDLEDRLNDKYYEENINT